MVLEEATSSREPSPFTSDGFQQQSPPSNDIDPYAGDQNPTVLPSRDSNYIQAAPGVYINTSNLPKPWSPFGNSSFPKPLGHAIQDACKAATQILGRPVRQEEADALAYHFGRANRIGSFGAPVGATLAGIMAFRGSSKMRFPGWTPNPEKYKFEKFLFLQGTNARFAWNMVRLNAYAFLGIFFGQIFFGSYALAVGSTGRMMDPRLKELAEEVQRRVKNGQRGELLAGGRKVDETPGQREGETFDMSRQRRNIQRSQQEARRNRNDDDMSPTGGSFGDEFLEMGNSGDSGLMNDKQSNMAAQQSQRQAEPATKAPARSYGDSNASASARQDSTAKQSGGSAWDRLRQQATSGQSQTRTAPTASEGSSSLDSFAFSNADEEKQLARTEAQKQFDARIERERSGKDFDEGGRGWRR